MVHQPQTQAAEEEEEEVASAAHRMILPSQPDRHADLPLVGRRRSAVEETKTVMQ